MATNSYQLPDEQYIELFTQKARFTLKLLKLLRQIGLEEGVNLDHSSHRFVWNLFQDIGYDTEEAARIYQKKHNPDIVKETSYDSILSPSREELLDAIKEVKSLLAPDSNPVG